MEIGAFEAKNRLSALLRLVEKGQKVYITRRGKRVAVLMSCQSEGAAPKVTLADFRAFRAQVKSGPETLAELIAEGHRWR